MHRLIQVLSYATHDGGPVRGAAIVLGWLWLPLVPPLGAPLYGKRFIAYSLIISHNIVEKAYKLFSLFVYVQMLDLCVVLWNLLVVFVGYRLCVWIDTINRLGMKRKKGETEHVLDTYVFI